MNKSQRNFTKILDIDILAGTSCKELFTHLLHFRALTTKRFYELSDYKRSLKSFHKLIKKYKKLGLIGTVQKDKFTEQIIYPKEKLAKALSPDKWQYYLIPKESYKVVHLYWQMAQTVLAIKKLKSDKCETTCKKSCLGPRCTDAGIIFDFHICRWGNPQDIIYGFYLFAPESSQDKAQAFKELERQICKNEDNIAIVFPESWDELFQFDMVNDYKCNTSRYPYNIVWCRPTTKANSFKELLSSQIYSCLIYTDLLSFIGNGHIKMIVEQERRAKEREAQIELEQRTIEEQQRGRQRKSEKKSFWQKVTGDIL